MGKRTPTTTAPARRRPGRPPRDPSAPSTTDRILAEATRLFAARGQDGVTMRDIADAVGIDVSSVHHHYPTKSGLHEACFARVFELERDSLEPLVRRIAEHPPTTPEGFLAALHRLLDAFLDFFEEHPETTYLWLRRWMDPVADDAYDTSYALPIYHQIEQALLEAAGHGLVVEPTPHVSVRSLVWASHGHITALNTAAGDPVAQARERREFRTFAHRFVDRLYTP